VFFFGFSARCVLSSVLSYISALSLIWQKVKFARVLFFSFFCPPSFLWFVSFWCSDDDGRRLNCRQSICCGHLRPSFFQGIWAVADENHLSTLRDFSLFW
jgi:hypothetical protein